MKYPFDKLSTALVSLQTVFAHQVALYLSSIGVVKDNDRLDRVLRPEKLTEFMQDHPDIYIGGTNTLQVQLGNQTTLAICNSLFNNKVCYRSPLPPSDADLQAALDLDLIYNAVVARGMLDHASLVLRRLRKFDERSKINAKKIYTEASEIEAFCEQYTNKTKWGDVVSPNYKASVVLDEIPFLRGLRRVWFLWDTIFVTLDHIPVDPRLRYEVTARLEGRGELPDVVNQELKAFKSDVLSYCQIYDSEESDE